MPASEVMSLYRQHKLHSGPGGPVVKKKKQAVAIQISMARKEGHHIPKVKGSFQQGGKVPETGDYLVHQGEVKVGTFDHPAPPTRRAKPTGPDFPSLINPNTGDWPGIYDAEGHHIERGRGGEWHDDVWHPTLQHRSSPEPIGSFQQGGLVPETGDYKVHQGEQLAFAKRMPPSYPQSQDVEDRRQPWNISRIGVVEGREQAQRSAQEKDIAARTNQAQHDEWNRAMRQDYRPMVHRSGDVLGQPPLPRDVPPASNDPHYAVEGLKGNVGARMREQGERAAGIRGSLQEGGSGSGSAAVGESGEYAAHRGEQVTDSTGGSSSGTLVPQTNAPPAKMGAPAGGPALKGKAPEQKGGDRGNPQLEAMQAAVAAPLHRVEGFKRGGMIPRTGIYRLHAGEHVIPANLAARYRQMKEKHA